MEWWQALVLGVVQGLTEFLPISSSGHLIIFPWLFGWDDGGLQFDAALHLGTLVAVLIYFRDEIGRLILAIPRAVSRPLPILKNETDTPEQDRWARLGLLIVIACIPGGIVGVLFASNVDDFFHTDSTADRAIAVIAAMLILVGLVLWVAERIGRRNRRMAQIAWIDAFWVGIGQAVAALLPGTSRSGATISAGMLRGLNREDAAKFSFLAGVPLILLAGLKSLVDAIDEGMSSTDVTNFAIGGVAAAIVGFVTIWGLLKFLQRQSTIVFVVYRILFGLFLFLMLAVR